MHVEGGSIMLVVIVGDYIINYDRWEGGRWDISHDCHVVVYTCHIIVMWCHITPNDLQ